MPYILSILLLLVMSLFVKASDYTYQMKGQFEGPEKNLINYTIRWSQKKDVIEGIYRDNENRNDLVVSGKEYKKGRSFKVTLPNNVGSLHFYAADVDFSQTGVMVPVRVVTQDSVGREIGNTVAKSRLTATARLAQSQEEQECLNLGALKGFCGIYQGIISELVDRQNRCDLLFADAAKLEFNPDGSLDLYLAKNPHRIGNIETKNRSREIDVSNRLCRPLFGMKGDGENCKKINLTGEFYPLAGMTHFRGNLLIFDEESKNTCEYSLSMDRQ